MSSKATDPARVNERRKVAIQAAGGASHVARVLGRERGEGVRRWYVDLHPTAEQARLLVELATAAGHKVSLQEILPGTYAGLTKRELGYTPK